MTRILLLDLLVEREEFGHGGNLEVVRPFLKHGGVEVWLLTPQAQSGPLGGGEAVLLTEGDVPNWDDEYPFSAERTVEFASGEVILRRMALPGIEHITQWTTNAKADAIICTGSRRNVSIWEDWMESAAELMRVGVKLGIPTLGICFGHQLLCHALGGRVRRASQRTDGVFDLQMSQNSRGDPLFTGVSEPVGLFTHRDHVSEVSDACVVLASTPHTPFAVVRVRGNEGEMLPIWGVQFHPEAAKELIHRSLALGHISEAELLAFHREHDGAAVLTNFSDVVMKERLQRP